MSGHARESTMREGRGRRGFIICGRGSEPAGDGRCPTWVNEGQKGGGVSVGERRVEHRGEGGMGGGKLRSRSKGS